MPGPVAERFPILMGKAQDELQLRAKMFGATDYIRALNNDELVRMETHAKGLSDTSPAMKHILATIEEERLNRGV